MALESRANVHGIGWVLPGGAGSGPGILELADNPPVPERNHELDDFDGRSFLKSVKGYLDPADGFFLSAAVLAMNEAPEPISERAGICSITQYGTTVSAYRFFTQLAGKGPRFASPLVFPHGYANSPGNLAAIEFGAGGPHMVLNGTADVREAMEFAVLQVDTGGAPDMLAGAFEAVTRDAVQDGTEVLNGAVVLWLSAAPGGLFPLELKSLRKAESAIGNDSWKRRGAVHALLHLLRGADTAAR